MWCHTACTNFVKNDAVNAVFYLCAKMEIFPCFTNFLFYVYKYFCVISLDNCGNFDNLCNGSYDLLNRMDLISLDNCGNFDNLCNERYDLLNRMDLISMDNCGIFYNMCNESYDLLNRMDLILFTSLQL
jgi:hypothetical protein